MSHLKAEQIVARITAGRPFIVGTYLSFDVAEQQCKVRGNPNVRENRVLIKHTVKNRLGIIVLVEFLEPGAIVERDASGDVLKVKTVKNELITQSIKTGAPCVITCSQFDRDGVGFKAMGTIEPVV